MSTVNSRLAALVIVCAVTIDCGKKGPPLTPIVRLPSPASIAATRRVGNDVYVTVNVPTTNIDASKPASLERVYVYGATALTPPSPARFLDIATLVAEIPVARAPDPTDLSGTIVPDPTKGALQGTKVTIRDPLSTEDMQPREIPVTEQERRRNATQTATTRPVQVLRRFYMTFPASDRGRFGPPSTVVEVPLTPLPEKVQVARVALEPTGVVLQFEPSGGLLGWLLDRSLTPERAPFDETAIVAAAPVVSAELPPGPTKYNVYVQVSPDPLALPVVAGTQNAWDLPMPTPVNMTPLAVLTYSDPLVIDGRERCYEVRAVRGSVESEPTDRQCVIAADVEPPAAPTGLTTLVGNGIQLIWDPNGEQDLGGYIVLRRDAPDATLLQLTPRPIAETRFIDTSVTLGRQYTYIVQAVDSRLPLPNVSEPAEVTETAR